ncbi:MAG: GNAT family N-acetyltransferase [Pseudomonadota bacterium]
MLWFPETSSIGQLIVRRGRPSDAPAIARIYVDSWRRTYQGLIPQHYLDGLSYVAFERHWRRTFAARAWAFVAEIESKVIGIASGGRCRRPGLASGELYVLYVQEMFQNRGIGRALFDACHLELATRGHPDMLVWVLADNQAREFYGHLGGELIGDNMLEIGGKQLREMAYIWRN